MALDRSSLDCPPAWPVEPTPRRPHTSSRAGPRPFGTRPYLVIAITSGVPLGVALYGAGTNSELLVGTGLTALAVVGAAIAVGAHATIQRLKRRCEVLGRARAESERARHALEVEHAELQRRNVDLEAKQLALIDGFELVDERTNGRLSRMYEAAGDELAELADEVHDESAEDA